MRVLLGASLVLAPLLSSHAQVTVVDAAPASNKSAPVAKQQPKPTHNPNAQLLYQLQLLQDEMMRMRGMLEEQQHQIQQLKQQRLDDYVNLDKRLTALVQQGGVAPQTSSPVTTTTGGSTAVVKPNTGTATASKTAQPSTANAENQAFNAAYALVKEKKFSEALAAFRQFVKQYPKSDYVPNAHYWSGKLLLMENKLAEAKEAFIVIIDKYPEHDKVPGSLYQVAEINYTQENRDIAKQQLQLLIERYDEHPGKVVTKIVRNAREFLNKHYP